MFIIYQTRRVCLRAFRVVCFTIVPMLLSFSICYFEPVCKIGNHIPMNKPNGKSFLFLLAQIYTAFFANMWMYWDLAESTMEPSIDRIKH